MDRRGILAAVVTAASGLFAVGAKRAEATAMTPAPAKDRGVTRHYEIEGAFLLRTAPTGEEPLTQPSPLSTGERE